MDANETWSGRSGQSNKNSFFNKTHSFAGCISDGTNSDAPLSKGFALPCRSTSSLSSPGPFLMFNTELDFGFVMPFDLWMYSVFHSLRTGVTGLKYFELCAKFGLNASIVSSIIAKASAEIVGRDIWLSGSP